MINVMSPAPAKELYNTSLVKVFQLNLSLMHPTAQGCDQPEFVPAYLAAVTLFCQQCSKTDEMRGERTGLERQ